VPHADINTELSPLWHDEHSAREAAAAVKRVVAPLLKAAEARKPRD
jgi:hypothetical protein